MIMFLGSNLTPVMADPGECLGGDGWEGALSGQGQLSVGDSRAEAE